MIKKKKKNYRKLTANIIPNGEKHDAIPLRERRQGCTFSLLLFNTVLKLPANALQTRKGNKRYTNWEGRNKTVGLKMSMTAY